MAHHTYGDSRKPTNSSRNLGEPAASRATRYGSSMPRLTYAEIRLAPLPGDARGLLRWAAYERTPPSATYLAQREAAARAPPRVCATGRTLVSRREGARSTASSAPATPRSTDHSGGGGGATGGDGAGGGNQSMRMRSARILAVASRKLRLPPRIAEGGTSRAGTVQWQSHSQTCAPVRAMRPMAEACGSTPKCSSATTSAAFAASDMPTACRHPSRSICTQRQLPRAASCGCSSRSASSLKAAARSVGGLRGRALAG
eukprot:scaffold236625_cov27-Tisochrysis_lutea.AAC.2